MWETALSRPVSAEVTREALVTSKIVILWIGYLIFTSRIVRRRWLLWSKVISHSPFFRVRIIPMKDKRKVIKYLSNHNIIHKLFLALLWKPKIVMRKYCSVCLSYMLPSSLKENWQICGHKNLHVKYKSVYRTCSVCFMTSRRQPALKVA